VPIEIPIQCASGALSAGVKWPGREAVQLPPSSAEVKNERSSTSILHTCLHGVQRNTFTFNIYIKTLVPTSHDNICGYCNDKSANAVWGDNKYLSKSHMESINMLYAQMHSSLTLQHTDTQGVKELKTM
jgi:hypothetical protein